MEKSIVLVDDHQMIRDGLRILLEQNSDARVAGEAATAAESVSLFASLAATPSAAIMDISLPDQDGIELVRALHKSYPDVSFIMYTMHVTSEYVQSALEAGAMAYVSKSSPSRELLLALESVWNGNQYLDSASLRVFLDRTIPKKETQKLSPAKDYFHESLTMQENRVFRLAAQSWSNARIAEELGLQEKTVQNYISMIYQKLGVKDRYELVEYARSKM